MEKLKKMNWLTGNADLCSKDLQLLLSNEDKFVVAKSALGIQVLNLKTGRIVGQILKEESGDCIDWIWQLKGQQDEILAITNKHVLAVQIPQAIITSKIQHPNHIKIPNDRRNVMVVTDPQNGQLERIYYVQKDAGNSWLHAVPLSKKKAIKFGQVSVRNGKTLYGCNKDIVVKVCSVVQGQAQLKLAFMTEDGYCFDSHLVPKSRPVSCLSVHHKEPVVATGDSTGQISVWRRSENAKYVFTTFHWHSLPIRSLTWAHEYGSVHLYSGGEEGAIIKWDTREIKKVAIVPRLGAKVVGITSTDSHVILATSNNVLKTFTSSMDPLSTIAGLCTDANKPIYWHSGSQTLALLSTERRQVQLYDPITKSEKLAFDVSNVNRILGERCDVVQNEDINFGLSNCGKWLATTETNWDTLSGNCLKIWHYNALSEFSLNTRINQPHTEPPTVVKFVTLSSKPALISCGRQRAKLWMYAEESGVWEPIRSFTYLGKKPTACSRSPDGSIIAITFEDSLCLWNASTFHLITCLSVRGNLIKSYSSVQFGSGTSNHLVFGGTEDSIFAWNLLENRLIKRLKIQSPRFFDIGSDIGVIHTDGITKIGTNLEVDKLVNDVQVSACVCNSDFSRIYFLSGQHEECRVGYLSIKQGTEALNRQEPFTTDPTALDNATRMKLNDDKALKNIFYAKVNSNFLTPELISNQVSSVSSLLVKKALPV